MPRAAAAHFDGLNADGLVAHILDDVFHGIALALLAVEIERGRWINSTGCRG